MKTVGIILHRTARRAAPARTHPGTATFVVLAWSLAVIFCAVSSAPVRAQPQIPDFNGVWAKYAYNYPKPYMAPGRGGGIANGYNNEYLKPWVVELLTRDNSVIASGDLYPTAHSLCYPEGVPYVFGESQMQILQGPSEITMLFGGEQEQSRTVYLNSAHPAHVVPSWYGDSVGHFEGESLVVDTVGIAANPQSGSMGFFGTPHSNALHLVERYRFLKDGESTVAADPRNARFLNTPWDLKDIIAGGKTLRLTFTVDDSFAYRKPWSSTVDLLPLKSHIEEYVCAENYREGNLLPLLPKAEIPDF